MFGDAAAMRAHNPLGQVPALVLDCGETLIDSAAILDWLDDKVGPERALVPAHGARAGSPCSGWRSPARPTSWSAHL
ncbi:MAG: glutathione S-transferase N-terminal domain-containing protein [Geminicoccaceae bacterium]